MKPQQVWRRVYPDMYIWKNMNTGEFVAIHGSRDKGWYNVKKTIPIHDAGEVVTVRLSPFFVLPVQPIGEYGTESNIMVRENEPWKSGTLADAVKFAHDYMIRTTNEKKKNW